MIAAVCDVNEPAWPDGDTVRLVQFRFQSRSRHARGTLAPAARLPSDPAITGSVTADDMVLRVGDQDRTVAIHAQVFRTIQGRITSWAAVARISARACANDGRDCAVGCDDAQSVPFAFEHIDVTRAIHRDGARVHKGCVRSLCAVPGNTALAVARDGPDDAGLEVDGADAAVVQIGEVEVLALWIERRAIETAELRLLRRSAVAAEAFGACSREGTHTAAVRVEVTNALVPGVGQEQFPIGKGGQTVHAIELRLPAQAAVAGKT